MVSTILVATSDPDLSLLVRDRLLGLNSTEVEESRIKFAKSAKEAEDALRSSKSEFRFAVVDSRLPRDRNTAPDNSASAAVDFINANHNRLPAIVLTHQQVAPAALDRECIPDNHAIALPLEHLEKPSLLESFVGMVGAGPLVPWTSIEVVLGRSSKCHLRNEKGELIEWGEIPLFADHVLESIAVQYEQYSRRPVTWPVPWLDNFGDSGFILFNNILIATFGSGLFSHLEAAKGLSGLSFRFSLEGPRLYAAPFEAICRKSRDRKPSFFLVHAAIARRVKSHPIRLPAGSDETLPRPTRLLFVSAQVCRSGVAHFSIPHLDPTTHQPRSKFYEVGALANIWREFLGLRRLERSLGKNLLEVRTLNLHKSKDIDPANAIMEELRNGRYDIVHFAGHSTSTDEGAASNTFLILPGSESGKAVSLPVEEFAECAGANGIRLVYLSSCRGSSARSVIDLVEHGVSHVIGFRWDVKDEHAARFAVGFYDDLLRKGTTIGVAFSSACNKSHKLVRETEDSIWASPILVAQSDDWALRPFRRAPTAPLPTAA